VTGVFFDAPEIAGKWIQIIRELVPQILRAGLLYDLHLDQTQGAEISAHNVGIAYLGIDGSRRIEMPEAQAGALGHLFARETHEHASGVKLRT
jgi:hypothetical protein